MPQLGVFVIRLVVAKSFPGAGPLRTRRSREAPGPWVGATMALEQFWLSLAVVLFPCRGECSLQPWGWGGGNTSTQEGQPGAPAW